MSDKPDYKFTLGQKVYNLDARKWATVKARHRHVGLGAFYFIAYANCVEIEIYENHLATEEPDDLPAAGEPPVLDEDDEIAVTWGVEKYSPRPYVNFDVGPISATTKIRLGESPEEAHERVWKWLEAQARKEFIAKHNQFLLNLQEL